MYIGIEVDEAGQDQGVGHVDGENTRLTQAAQRNKVDECDRKNWI